MGYFKKIIGYLIVLIFVWNIPEIYLASHNLSNYIYNESTTRPEGELTIKVVEKLPYLPAKYSFLRSGRADLRVEIANPDKSLYRSVLTTEGSARFENVFPDKYVVRVSKPGSFNEEEVLELESKGFSALHDEDIYATNLDRIDVSGDTFVIAILN